MFPSTAHFRFLPCPFHSEGHCGRVYCHYRHLKNTDNEKAENDKLSAWEKEICDALKIDRDTFNVLVNEEDENVHEKLINNKLKSKFPAQAGLIDDFRFPESLDDTDFSSISFPTNDETDELVNLTDETSLEEEPLAQFLEEDAEQTSNSECGGGNTAERRHIIVSCLDKIDKREGSRRPIVLPKTNSNASVNRLVTANEADVPENTDDVATQQLFPTDLANLKQEASDSSESEDNAEVDKILSQMELLNPQLFSADKVDPYKNEPTAFEANDNVVNSGCSEDSSAQAPSFTVAENRVGRINLKSIAAINNEFNTADRSVRLKSGRLYEPASVVPSHPAPDPIVLAAAIAEQNRLKNVFKSTICSNIDQFFDLSDACKVYGTEIFNLLEPLLNYLIEKLNPEFNFEKLRQLHSQNMSLSCALPFVTCCDHAVNCIECHNLLAAATSRSRIRTANKSTETESPMNDIPLRKIQAGLYDITKEMLSLQGETAVPKVTASVSCQTSGERGEQHRSSSSSSSHRRHSSHHRHGERKSKDTHDSKSRDRNDSGTRASSSSGKRASGSGTHHSSKSSSSTSSSSRKREKRRKSDDGGEESSSEDEHGGSDIRVKSSRSDESSRKKKRPSSDRSAHVEEKKARRNSKPEPSVDGDAEKRDNELDSDCDADDHFGTGLSGGGSDSDSVNESLAGGNGKSKSVSQDSADDDSEDEEKMNSNEFVDRYPTTANKKRVSHVTDKNSSQVYRKQVMRKHIPSPAEIMHQRLQNRVVEEARNEVNSLFTSGGAASEKLRISHVPNVNSILKAKERIQHDIVLKPPPPPLPVRTIAQTSVRGQRVAHAPAEPPKPKDLPVQAHLARPTIKEFKSANNIPVHIRQNGLDRLYNAYAKKVPADIASALALKEEQTIHEKVTIQKVYQNSLVMAIHRIVKETPDKLLVKTSEFPLEINGLSIYDLLSKHILTNEQLEINGFPIPHQSRPKCCRISMKAIHYKPLAQKRSGDRFYCQQCKELFDVDAETGLPITPSTGCRFHPMRPRKEHGRTRHELFYPCCNSGISESGCMSSEHHTPDTTDDDCLPGFVETRDPPPGERRTRRIYSLDCEMCSTTKGTELTRVTVIRHDCQTVYDSLVKPRNPILDYCTKFSGITEEKLRRVTKRLEQVREELFKFIFKDSILIGHSLENDLKALKILHYKIVDTSVMYPHRDAPERKFSLKNLSANVVQFLIQESEFGHDSKEDALACMKLVWKKIREDAQCFRPKKIISSPAAKNLVGTTL